MKKQIRLQKQIRIVSLFLSLVFAVTLMAIVSAPIAACELGDCKIEVKETTVNAGEEITFVVVTINESDAESFAIYAFGADPLNPQDGCKFEIDLAAGGSWNVNTYTTENPGEWEVTVICIATLETETRTREDTITITASKPRSRRPFGGGTSEDSK